MANVYQFFQELTKWKDDTDDIFDLFPELLPMLDYKQNNPYHVYDVWNHTMAALLVSNGDFITNLAILFHDCGKPHSTQINTNGVMHFRGHAKESLRIAEPALKKLHIGTEIRDQVLLLIKYHDAQLQVDSHAVSSWNKKLGNEQFYRLLELMRCDIMAQNPALAEERLVKLIKIREQLDEIVKQEAKPPFKLAINGNDLKKAGYKEGPYLGITLRKLERDVKNGDLQNDRTKLLSIAKKMKTKKKEE